MQEPLEKMYPIWNLHFNNSKIKKMAFTYEYS